MAYTQESQRRMSHARMLALIGSKPRRVGIILAVGRASRGARWAWRFMRCDLPGCRRQFWHGKTPHDRHCYCCDEHRAEGTRQLNLARQLRWQRRQRQRLRKKRAPRLRNSRRRSS